MRIGRYEFSDLGEPTYERDGVGRVASHRPQDRFSNPRGLPKHRYGDLAYCKFSVAGMPKSPGVYAFAVDGRIAYVGKAGSIAQRFMPGYRVVSPRMCFEGGPQTTCRINALIADAVRASKNVRVLVLETTDFHNVESELVGLLCPPWNLALPMALSSAEGVQA